MNRVHFDRKRRLAVIEAGAGFDGEYELNFRAPSLRERIGKLYRRSLRQSHTAIYLRAFSECGGTPDWIPKAVAVLGPPLQPHKIL
ncbi:MAG: hypothetical protein NZM12_01670, partial [Steroidobacteraceae bacterium]|nr:hypothetical protein [Steroidobacteraceae bacterium]